MVLGDVIGVIAGRVVRLDQPQPRLVLLAKRAGAAVEMVENAEFHGCSRARQPLLEQIL